MFLVLKGSLGENRKGGFGWLCKALHYDPYAIETTRRWHHAVTAGPYVGEPSRPTQSLRIVTAPASNRMSESGAL